jgi:hypothetical protein
MTAVPSVATARAATRLLRIMDIVLSFIRSAVRSAMKEG